MGWLTEVADTVGSALERTQPGYNRQRNLAALGRYNQDVENRLQEARQRLGLLSEDEPADPVAMAAYRALLSGEEPVVPMSEAPAQPVAPGDSVMTSAPAASVSSLASLAQGLMPGRQSVDVSESKSRAGVSSKQLQESESEYARSKRELLGMNRSSAEKEARLAVMQAMRPTVLMGMYGTEGADEWDKQMQALALGLQRDDADRQKALEKVLTLEQKNIASQRSSESARAKIEAARVAKEQNDNWRKADREGRLTLDYMKMMLGVIENRQKRQMELYKTDAQLASSLPQFYSDAMQNNIARRQALLNKSRNLAQLISVRGGKQAAAIFGSEANLKQALFDLVNEDEASMQNDFIASAPDQGVFRSLFPSAEDERKLEETKTLPKLGGVQKRDPLKIVNYDPSRGLMTSPLFSSSISGTGLTPESLISPEKPVKIKKSKKDKKEFPLGSKENPIVKGEDTPKPKSGQWYISPKTGKLAQMP